MRMGDRFSSGMKLKIELPQSLLISKLIKQSDIPCLCRVSGGFEMVFQDPLPDAVGEVLEWDRNKLEQRVPAGGGGTEKGRTEKD